MKARRIAVLALSLGACASDFYTIGMPREEAYERIDSLEFRPLTSELRLDPRHDLILVPEAGFPNQFDATALSADRQAFSRFKPTDTKTSVRNIWIRTMLAVDVWHGLIFRDFDLVAVIDDEEHDRLLQRVAFWMQDHVDSGFDAGRLDPLKLNVDRQPE